MSSIVSVPEVVVVKPKVVRVSKPKPKPSSDVVVVVTPLTSPSDDVVVTAVPTAVRGRGRPKKTSAGDVFVDVGTAVKHAEAVSAILPKTVCDDCGIGPGQCPEDVKGFFKLSVNPRKVAKAVRKATAVVHPIVA